MNTPIASPPANIPMRLPNSSEASSTLAQTNRLLLGLLLAAILYFGFACYLTWPLVTATGHYLYGQPGDSTGSIAFFGVLSAHNYDPFLPGTITQLAAPEGRPIPWPVDIASAPSVLTLYTLSALFGPISALALYILIGYTLTGVITFLFASRVTGNAWASLIAGWAFAFYPFAAINGQVHPDNVQGWVLALALWRLIELTWHPARRNGLIAGIAVALAMWWSAYFTLLTGVTYAVVTTITVAIAVRRRNVRSILAPQLITAIIVVVFLSSMIALSIAAPSDAGSIRTHHLSELYHWAANPLQYVVPDSRSPLFGRYTSSYLESIQHNPATQENTLYVGLTATFLALVALAAASRRRLVAQARNATLILWPVAIIAVVTSMPPKSSVFGLSLPFPSYFIAQATTTWRVYSRFAMIVMLAISVLAAVGLHALTRGRRSRAYFIGMTCATILIPLDLWWPSSGSPVSGMTTPPIYRMLARMPAGGVAEYPLPLVGKTYSDIVFQSVYNKPLINGYLDGSFQEWRAAELSNLADPQTAARLATLGVRYVLLDSRATGIPVPKGPGTPRRGFRLIASESYARLYLVTARPDPAIAAAGEGLIAVLPTREEGFGAISFVGGIPITWLDSSSGTIDLTGPCRVCRGVLSMVLRTVGRPRHVILSDSRRRVLARAIVRGSKRIAVHLSFSKRIHLTLAATPGPEAASGTAFPVSLRITALKFEAR